MFLLPEDVKLVYADYALYKTIEKCDFFSFINLVQIKIQRES